MSKLVDAMITCPLCGKQYPVKLFRTLWGEHQELRDKVMNDEVNVCTCPHCGHSFTALYPFMYVDVKAGFAVWWEPVPDADIDADAKEYANMFGSSSYYATAPRIADWEEFKETIRKYYRGELQGGKIEKMDFTTLRKSTGNSQNKGCLGLVTLLLLMGGMGVCLL